MPYIKKLNPKKRGAPSKPPELLKSQYVCITITKGQKKAMQVLARKQGISLAKYIRQCALATISEGTANA